MYPLYGPTCLFRPVTYVLPDLIRPFFCFEKKSNFKFLISFASSRMSPVLAELNIIPEHQFGFRSGHGTVEQCHRIKKSITDAFECKQYCAEVFLDVKQAFDKVWHLGYKI